MRGTILLTISFLVFYAASGQKVTFYDDVAPLIHKNCTPCHRPGGAGPFQLLTYEDVAKRAPFIKKVTQSRYMPPWQADPVYRSFARERLLSDEEIKTIASWVDQQAPKGKGSIKKEDILEQFVSGTQYHRAPDLTLEMPEPFLVKGDNLERFIVFKLPFELDEAKNVEAIEFFSNSKKAVHHANFAIHPVPDTTVDLYNTDPFVNLTEDSRLKYSQYFPYKDKLTYYGGWIPGTSYESYPADMGWIMPRRGVILLTVHYAPGAKDIPNLSGIHFFFKDTPIERKVQVISLGSGGVGEDAIEPYFIIQPDTVKKFTLKVTTPAMDQSLMYVWPHMHLLGKEFKAYAVTPEKDTIQLVHIPDWNFRWQEIYQFKKLVKIPKGSVLTLEGTYDNTASNPDNPFDPPRLIYSAGDMKTTDEMLTMVMVFLPYREGDENISLAE